MCIYTKYTPNATPDKAYKQMNQDIMDETPFDPHHCLIMHSTAEIQHHAGAFCLGSIVVLASGRF